MSNNFKGYEASGVTTETAVFTGPAATQTTVIGMTVANVSGVPTLASVKKNGAYIVKDAPIPVGGSMVAIGGDQKLAVEAASTMSVIADNAVDVVISTLEIS